MSLFQLLEWKSWDISVKYIIILKIISIIVFEICNQNHDQGSLSFKKNTHGNKERIKLIAEFHLNDRSFILWKRSWVKYIIFFLLKKKNLLVPYLTFSFSIFVELPIFSIRPKNVEIYIFVIKVNNLVRGEIQIQWRNLFKKRCVCFCLQECFSAKYKSFVNSGQAPHT